MRVAATAATFVLLAGIAPLRGESILRTFCSVALPDGSTADVTSTSSCTVIGPLVGPGPLIPSAEARASTGTALLPPGYYEEFPGAAFSATAFVEALVHVAPYQTLEPPSRAQASAELFLRTATPGPPRAGLIDVLFRSNINMDSGVSDARLVAMIGPLLAEVIDPIAPCSGACIGTFAFPLGQPFDIYVAAFAEGAGEPIAAGPFFRNAQVEVLFQLRELDGTPVYPVSIPEPATVALLTLGLILLLLSRNVRKSLRIWHSWVDDDRHTPNPHH